MAKWGSEGIRGRRDCPELARGLRGQGQGQYAKAKAARICPRCVLEFEASPRGCQILDPNPIIFQYRRTFI